MKIKEVGRYVARGCLGGIYIVCAGVGAILLVSSLGFWVVVDVMERACAKPEDEE